MPEEPERNQRCQANRKAPPSREPFIFITFYLPFCNFAIPLRALHKCRASPFLLGFMRGSAKGTKGAPFDLPGSPPSLWVSPENLVFACVYGGWREGSAFRFARGPRERERTPFAPFDLPGHPLSLWISLESLFSLAFMGGGAKGAPSDSPEDPESERGAWQNRKARREPALALWALWRIGRRSLRATPHKRK